MYFYYRIVFLFSLSFCFSLFSTYRGQFGQDRWLNETYFKNKRNGVFLDVGAHDGITISNTYFFEKELGWTGICIDPLDEFFGKLQSNRSCICIHGCAAPHDGEVDFIEVTERTSVLSGMLNTYQQWPGLKHAMKEYGGSYTITKKKAYTLKTILEHYQVDTIDYLSIDIEGGEAEVLSTIDFSKVNIYIIEAENNHNTKDVQNLLESKGFKLIHRMNVDEIYINPHFFDNAKNQ